MKASMDVRTSPGGQLAGSVVNIEAPQPDLAVGIAGMQPRPSPCVWHSMSLSHQGIMGRDDDFQQPSLFVERIFGGKHPVISSQVSRTNGGTVVMMRAFSPASHRRHVASAHKQKRPRRGLF